MFSLEMGLRVCGMALEPFCPFAEGFFGLTDLGALEVAHFEGHLLQGGSDERQGSHVTGVPVPLQYLRGNAGRFDAQFPAHVILNERRDVGKIAHGAAHLAGLDTGGGRLEAGEVPLHLLIPERPFEAEAGNVGVDAVRAADARGFLELQGAAAQHLQKFFQVLQKDGVGLLEQITVGGVYHISRGETVVHPFALRTQAFAHGTGEGHHFVAGLLLNFADTGHIKAGRCPDLVYIFGGNHAQLAPGFTGEDFHLQVGAELVFLGPYVPHYFA